MKFSKIIALSLIACASFTSCLKSEYRYNGFIAFANVVDETHLTADGNVSFVITENSADAKFMEVESKRIVINCDLLDMNSPQSIKLNAYSGIKVKPAVFSDEESVKTFGRDSVYIHERARYLTANGDNVYVTLYVSVPKIKDSETEHELELVLDKASDEKELRFCLYHQANGDVFTKDTPSDKRSSEEYYVSFTIQDLVKNIKVNDNTKYVFTTAFDNDKENNRDNKDGK